MIKFKEKRILKLKTKAIWTAIAVIAAVALPELLHLIGIVGGSGSALGEIFLPMHISILLLGLLAGPVAGALAGGLSPIISFALTSMPKENMLPFMVIELFVYGYAAGKLASFDMPCIFKVVLSQLAGRAVKFAAIVLGFYAFNTAVTPNSFITSLYMGIAGIALQLILIPVIVRLTEKNNEM